MIDCSRAARRGKAPRTPEIIRKKKVVGKADTFAFSGPGKGLVGFGKLSELQAKKEESNG